MASSTEAPPRPQSGKGKGFTKVSTSHPSAPGSTCEEEGIRVGSPEKAALRADTQGSHFVAPGGDRVDLVGNAAEKEVGSSRGPVHFAIADDEDDAQEGESSNASSWVRQCVKVFDQGVR